MLLLDNTSVRCKKKKTDLAKEVPLIVSPCYYEKLIFLAVLSGVLPYRKHHFHKKALCSCFQSYPDTFEHEDT